MGTQRSRFGRVARNGSNWRAWYTRDAVRHEPGRTFSTEEAGRAWLRAEQVLIDRGEWTPPARRRAEEAAAEEQAAAVAEVDALTLATYARDWCETRRARGTTRPLHPRTKSDYLSYLDGILAPLASRPLASITATDVAQWLTANDDTPTLAHHAHAFARAVMETARKRDRLVVENPFSVEPVARPERTDPTRAVQELDHASVARLAELVQPRDRLLVLLLAYGALRTSEACALRRRDLASWTDADGVAFIRVNVDRAISTYDNQRHESTTKTGATGERWLYLPPHLTAEVAAHLDKYAAPGADGLLFPSTNPSIAFRTTQQINGHATKPATKSKPARPGYGWYGARETVGMPGMRLHWLRHWGATQWLKAGLPEPLRVGLMGHAQGSMTNRYTHPAPEELAPYARKLAEAAGWTPPSRPASPLEAVQATPAAPEASLVAVLAVLDDDALTAAVAALDDDARAAALAALPPARVAAIVGKLARPRPSLRVLDGGNR